MIKVTINSNKVSITGHALYDDYGKDIVCASVSSIVITTVNAILRIDAKAIDYNDKNGVIINILKHDDVVKNLIDNLIDLLEKLEKQYPKYIEIRRC